MVVINDFSWVLMGDKLKYQWVCLDYITMSNIIKRFLALEAAAGITLIIAAILAPANKGYHFSSHPTKNSIVKSDGKPCHIRVY
jgi:hypothetical protein